VALQQPSDNTREYSELATRIRELSIARFGSARDTALAGLHSRMLDAQHRLLMCAQADGPVLITGETGTGKELFARALFLLSKRRKSPYLCVNCSQYQDSQLIASELFGHRRGSFTGAVADHRGIFEEADGGVVFLDEVAELSPVAQAMLLRALSEGEIVPVGDTRARPVNTRVFAATGRDLRSMVSTGKFREDLYFRLRYLHISVPPLRDRGDDWEIIARLRLRALATNYGTCKVLSDDSVERLRAHWWPGNVRELRGIIETAFHIADSVVIEPDAFIAHFDDLPILGAQAPEPDRGVERSPPPHGLTAVRDVPGVASVSDTIYQEIVDQKMSFWSLVYEPFMARDLSRPDARAIIERGLVDVRGSYKRLISRFGIDEAQYLRFMDFLRHHRLKPPRS
jgi:transcriptional regulator with GAF, ATPase, and Fis domain